ncbi:hypothetical protein [Streptomyces sp. AK02-01A]|uniref:hypothetical protein n=1 Tax=Streptomyces sp. AK02-01A TaxID=3028648 RepID=UPI0029ACF5B9|nr:hypothetical protein [Streptomyces sp. AK02-01A]MDX3852553.1 hypothetical protein [Streptomyces sp. AK02-01A]
MRIRHLARASAVALAVAGTLITATTSGATGIAQDSAWEIASGADTAETFPGSVSSVGPELAWASGSKDGAGLILRWDGARWSKDPAPGLPEVWEWSSVSAVSATDVWAYGFVSLTPKLFHYDGTRWTGVTVAGDVDTSFWTSVPIKAVPGRLFMGGTSLRTWTNGTWETFGLPSNIHIRDIDALSADDAWATGMVYPASTGRAVVYHWDGATWTQVEQPPTVGTEIDQVSQESPDSVYVSGSARDWEDAPSIAHWNGTGWEDITGPMEGFELHGMTVDGVGGLWVAGRDADMSKPAFWRYDGASWTRELGKTAPIDDTEGMEGSYVFEDITPVDGTGALWAIGSYGVYSPRFPYTNYALAERFTPGTPAAERD